MSVSGKGASVTLTSGDPSKLLLSLSPADPPTASVTVAQNPSGYPSAYYPVYAHALDGPADVKLITSSDGFTSTSVVSIQPSSLMIGSNSVYGFSDKYSMNPNATLDLGVVGIVRGSSSAYSYTPLPFRAGIGIVQATVVSSAQDVVKVQSDPIYLNGGANMAPFRVTGVAPGQSTLTVTPAAGFRPPPAKLPGATTTITVIAPSIVLPDVPLGMDLRVPVSLNIKDGPLLSGVDFTFTSSDPTLVKLSAAPQDKPSDSVVVRPLPGSAFMIYVTGYAASGTAQIQVTAPGYGAATSQVKLSPLTLTPGFSSPFTFVTTNPVAPFNLYPVDAPPNQIYSNYALRVDSPDYPLQIASSNTAILSPVSPQLTLHAGDSQIAIPLKFSSAGTANLSFQGPNGFTSASVPVTVQGGSLYVNQPGPIGANLQDVMTINNLSAGTMVTVTSSDPSKLLISSSATSLGQASVMAAAGQQNVQFWLQALSASGTVTVTASAANYVSGTATITLNPAVAVFFSTQIPSPLTTTTPAFSMDVGLRPLNGYAGPQALRAGATPITVAINSTDSTVGTVTPPTLVFNPGESKKSISFRPVAPGFTLLTLGIPPGFADPVAQGQQLLNVIPAK